MDRASSDSFEALTRSVTDWDRLIRLAQRHRLTPFVYPILSKLPATVVPQASLMRLEDLFVANTARNAFLARELAKTWDLFQSNRIRAIPFKGLTLASMLYGDPSLRQADDLDFFIHPEDLARAKAILVSAGYLPFPCLTSAEEKAYARIGASHCMRSQDGEYYVDLETQIAPRQFSFHMPIDALWAGLEEWEMDGRQYRTLSAANLMLILCVHGAKHRWERLIWMMDIAMLLRKRHDVNLPEVLETARKYGGLRMLLVGLQAAGEVAGEPLPDEASEAMRRDPAAARLARAAVRGALEEAAPRRSLRRELLFDFAIHERWRDRLRIGLTNLFMPTYSDWKALPLPERLFPLYYVLHPFRVLVSAVIRRRFWQDLPKSNESVGFLREGGSPLPPQGLLQKPRKKNN